MKTTASLLGASLAFSASGLAQLSLEPAWGSESFSSVASRAFETGSTTTNFNFAPSIGGAGSLSSSNSLTESRGSSSSSSVLDASSGLSVPVIRTFASTNDGNWAAFGSTVTVEGYTYNGTGTATFNLDANLTGSFTNLDNNFAGNFATLSIWTPGGGGFPPIFTRTNDPGLDDGFFFSSDEGSYLEFGFNRLDTLSLEQNGIGGEDVLSGTLSWDMEPGDTVYLWASGLSRVYGANSTADARNTLTTSFQDATGLTSLSGGVIPEPSTAVLGLLGVFALARRKR